MCFFPLSVLSVSCGIRLYKFLNIVFPFTLNVSLRKPTALRNMTRRRRNIRNDINFSHKSDGAKPGSIQRMELNVKTRLV